MQMKSVEAARYRIAHTTYVQYLAIGNGIPFNY